MKKLLYDYGNGMEKASVYLGDIKFCDFSLQTAINTYLAFMFGDLYVRDNDLLNQNLIKTVEENEGEVITTPYSEYMKIMVTLITERIYKEGHYRKYAQLEFLKSLIPLVEDKYIL